VLGAGSTVMRHVIAMISRVRAINSFIRALSIQMSLR